MRVAVWGWSGELPHQDGELLNQGGETVKQRLEGGLKVGDLVEVKKILVGEEWALASRPGEDKVPFYWLSHLGYPFCIHIVMPYNIHTISNGIGDITL